MDWKSTLKVDRVSIPCFQRHPWYWSLRTLHHDFDLDDWKPRMIYIYFLFPNQCYAVFIQVWLRDICTIRSPLNFLVTKGCFVLRLVDNDLAVLEKMKIGKVYRRTDKQMDNSQQIFRKGHELSSDELKDG